MLIWETLFFLQSWIIIWLDRVSFVGIFSFLHFEYIMSLLSGLQIISEKCVGSVMEISLKRAHFFFSSLLAFKILSMSSTFEILIIIYLRVHLFGFTLFGILQALWIWMSVFFPMLAKFSSLFFKKFSAPFSLLLGFL